MDDGEPTVAFRGQTFPHGESKNDIPSYFREVNNKFQCKAVLDLHVCVFVCVCLYQKHFFFVF